MQSSHMQRCIVVQRGVSSAGSSQFMVDRLQDKVANDDVADAAHSSTYKQFEHP